MVFIVLEADKSVSSFFLMTGQKDPSGNLVKFVPMSIFVGWEIGRTLFLSKYI